jgi:hypothetical protein
MDLNGVSVTIEQLTRDGERVEAAPDPAKTATVNIGRLVTPSN